MSFSGKSTLTMKSNSGSTSLLSCGLADPRADKRQAQLDMVWREGCVSGTRDPPGAFAESMCEK